MCLPGFALNELLRGSPRSQLRFERRLVGARFTRQFFGGGFEPAIGWQVRQGRTSVPGAHKPPWRVALPAFGGLRHQRQIVEPLASLSGFQEFFFRDGIT